MQLRQWLILAAGACACSACKEGWTDESRRMYLQSCRESPDAARLSPAQQQAYCDCALERTMQHYPDIEQVLANKDSVQLRAAIKECLDGAGK